MLLILVDKDGEEMIGSDGYLRPDMRKSLENIKTDVRNRNEMFKKNFPHKIAYGFKFWDNKSSSRYESTDNLTVHYI